MRGGSDVLAPGQPDKSARWRDLRRRAISAAVLAPVALACVWFGGVAFIALIGLAAVLSVAEWVRLCRAAAAPALMACGTAWILLACAGLVFVRADPRVGRANVLFLLLLVWASDIGAYLVGRLVGGAKLAPVISPGKTWSGAAGGIAAAVLVGFAADAALPTHAGPGWIVAITILFCIIGQAGDLTESGAKRHFGVKDSGSLIPGHGGLLDRLDALLAVAPFAALLALCLGRGVLFWE
jgi:phosphatidate cytidylyltransferase